MLHFKSLKSVPLLAVMAFGLAGCFDLDQSVSLNRDGSGTYGVTVAAAGPFGDALKNGKSDMHFGNNPNIHPRTTTVIANGKVSQTTDLDFKQLSDLSLSNETVAIKVKGRDLFGFGKTHAIFRRAMMVDNEMRDRHQSDVNDEQAKALLASIFGDHTYVFRVHLPGAIDWIAPVYADGVEVKPQVTSDSSGSTVIWRMPLLSMIQSKALRMSVGFSTYGPLADSETKLENVKIPQMGSGQN
jgi:hypothetical protein